MIHSACAGRRPASLGASSPLKSLAWTSLRTPNCRLASARARGADCFTLSMSSGAGVEETIMENIFPCCAGLDVHKDSVEACVRRIEPNGRWHQQTRHWGTMTRDLLAMADWMAAKGVTQVAMESAGVLWNRINKVLQDTNIKLSSVATDVLGVSGRAMLEALITGEEDPVKLAHLAQRKLRSKIPELEKALEGHLTEHHRFMLQLLWKQLA